MFKPDIPKFPNPFKILVYPVIFIFSILPFPVIYFVGDVIFFILYYLTAYRKIVVYTNLKNAFPSKSEKEIQQLLKKYYHHLADLFVEIIKGITIKPEHIQNRVLNHNVGLYEKLHEENAKYLVVMSHCGNWEWTCLMSQLTCKQQVYCTYKPLSNKGFNALLYKIRSKFKAVPVSMNETLRLVVSTSTEPQGCVIALIGDQNPSNSNQVYWSESFLNQETAFLNGPAKIAKKFNLPIIYLRCIKPRRGYYETFSSIIIDEPQNFTENQISEIIVSNIDSEIKAQPEIWLWSHRRWKHKRNSN